LGKAGIPAHNGKQKLLHGQGHIEKIGFAVKGFAKRIAVAGNGGEAFAQVGQGHGHFVVRLDWLQHQFTQGFLAPVPEKYTAVSQVEQGLGIAVGC